VQLRYSYRLYPNLAQREALRRALGCAGGVQRRARRAQGGLRGWGAVPERRGLVGAARRR